MKAQNMPAYYTVQFRFTGVLLEGGRSKNKIQWNNKSLIQRFGREHARTFYYATRKIYARIIHQNTEYGVYTLQNPESNIQRHDNCKAAETEGRSPPLPPLECLSFMYTRTIKSVSQM